MYEPQTTAEKILRTSGEFLPALAGGPEGLAAKLATRVVAPALASEAVGTMTDNPVAKAAAAIGGNVLAHRFVPNPEMSLEDIKAAAQNLYRSPAIAEAEFKQPAVSHISDSIQSALRANPFKFNDKNAKPVFDALEDLKTPAGPQPSLGAIKANPPVKAAEGIGNLQPHTYEDFAALRGELQRIAGNVTENNATNRAAASVALETLDKVLQKMPQAAMANGSARDFSNAYLKAKQDYAVAMTGGKVEDKLRNAELQAASANSGQNINNATRQKLRPLLTSKKGQRGFTESEQAAIEQAVRGSPIGNVLRYGGNLLGGGGGIGQLATGLGGMWATGSPFGLGLPLAGRAAKAIGDMLTKRKADAIVNLIKQRSPSYQEFLQNQPVQLPTGIRLGLIGGSGGILGQ